MVVRLPIEQALDALIGCEFGVDPLAGLGDRSAGGEKDSVGARGRPAGRRPCRRSARCARRKPPSRGRR
eukprot:5829587-Pyramimonas_sp.AAC.1